MKKRKLFSTAAAALAAVSMLSVLPMNAWAAGSSYSNTLTTADDKKSTSFNKYLVMDVNANVPNATFTYSIASGTAISADTTNGKLAVLAGVGTPVFKNNDAANTGSDTAGEAKFTATDLTIEEATAATNNDTVAFTATDNITDEKYAKKTLTIDFSSVAFTEPGVYRYIITESGTNQGITNDSKLKRTLDVYVEDDTTGETKQLKIAGYVMYSDEINTAPSATVGTGNQETDIPNGAEAGTKSNSYTNTYATHDLTFGKEVTGNQGSKDKYFKFTVNISGAVAGTIYTVDISKADAISGTNAATLAGNQSQTNPTSITVGSDGTISTDFYLQDVQYITIKGLADKTKYEITEEAEDYTSTEGITAVNSTFKVNASDPDYIAMDGAVSNTTSGITADVFTGYTNDRTGVIPTGILISIVPAAIIGLIVIGGIIFLVAKNKRRETEED